MGIEQIMGMLRQRDRVTAVGLVLAGMAYVGCAGDQSELVSPGSSMPAAITAAPTGSALPPAAPEGAPPLSTVLTTDPTQLQKMFSAASVAPMAAMTPGGSVGDPIEGDIKMLAAKQAPGMLPDGPIAKGTLQEGGHLEMMATLVPGKCYSVVGFSPSGGVTDLDLHLLPPPVYNILSGEDTTDDNMPVIAKAPNPMCPSVAVPLPYKIDIFAERGSGAIGVQLFSKAK
jgi:hypothetical protein